MQDFAIETDLHKVVFSNRGATVRNWVLKAYKDSKGQPLELVNQRAMKPGKIPAPFALAFKNAPSNSTNDKLYRVTKSDDGLGVTFDYSDGRITSKKTFQFAKNSYLVKITSQVLENGVLIPHSLVWRGGFGDSTGTNPTADARTLYYDATNKSLEKQDASDAKDAPVSASGNYAFAGIEDKYFAGVALLGHGRQPRTHHLFRQCPHRSGQGRSPCRSRGRRQWQQRVPTLCRTQRHRSARKGRSAPAASD